MGRKAPTRPGGIARQPLIRSGRQPLIRPARPPSHHFRITRRGRFVRRALASMGLVALVLVVIAVSLFFYTRGKINSKGVDCPTCAPVDAGSAAPMNVLVLGSDARSVLDKADLGQFDPTGADRNSGQRADSIVLLHIDPKAAKAVALALPRDLRVKGPNGQYQKINGFYNQGVPTMVQVVQHFTGLPVHHYVEVNFNSFRTITDTLGGVQVRFTKAIDDPNSGLRQPAGCNLLTGDQALAFVRIRDIDSDFGRIARQQLFIKLMMEKILSAGTLLNPVKVVQLINLGATTMTHDSGLGLSAIQSLLSHFHNFNSSAIDFRVVPSSPQTIAGGDFVVPNRAQSSALFAAMKNGKPLPDYGRQGVSSVDASSVETTILNGTGVAGIAARARDDLKVRGYDILTTSNADRADYDRSIVYYTPGNQQRAQYLAQDTLPSAQVEALPPAITVSGGDAVMVLGKDFLQNETFAPPKPSLSPDALLPAGPAQALQTSQPWFSAC